MKSSGAVYEASLRTFVLRFDLDTDLKKPLVDINSP